MGDISLNPGPCSNPQLSTQKEWQTFCNWGLHFIHLNINSLLPKIDALRDIAKRKKSAVIGISGSRTDNTVLDPEIYNENYNILCFNRNWYIWGVTHTQISLNFLIFLIKIYLNSIHTIVKFTSKAILTLIFLKKKNIFFDKPSSNNNNLDLLKKK